MGQTFSVVSDEEEDHVRRVAAYVDERIRQQAGRASSSFGAAVVTALNIASEYQKLRAEHGRVQKTIDRLATRLGVQMDSQPEQGGKEIDASGRATSPALRESAERPIGEPGRANR